VSAANEWQRHCHEQNDKEFIWQDIYLCLRITTITLFSK
jgi:hypothetical protein